MSKLIFCNTRLLSCLHPCGFRINWILRFTQNDGCASFALLSITAITTQSYFTSNCTLGATLAPASAEKRAFGEAPAKPATMFVGNWRMVVLNAWTVSL